MSRVFHSKCRRTTLFLESNFGDPATNLAIDEALLEQAESGQRSDEVLRIWLPRSTAVIVGRSSRVSQEVNVEQAKLLGVPILRRTSGGAAVVLGAGCMAYSLILSYSLRPGCQFIDVAHRLVMHKMNLALRELEPRVAMNGTSDLVIGEMKISGNSLRCRKRYLLYHGTILVDMDLELIDQLLRHPPREPDYRRGRRHVEFLTNLRLPMDSVINTIRSSWSCDGVTDAVPPNLIDQLLRDKYCNPSWNLQR